MAVAGGPALAQVPEIGFRFTSGLDGDTMEAGNCVLANSDGISIAVGQADPTTRFASAVEAHVSAIVLSGPNRFADPHGHTPREGQARPSKFLTKADGTGLIAAKNGYCLNLKM